MKMRTFLLEFLKELEVTLPPSNGGHHAITFGRYGNEEGMHDVLVLQVYFEGKFHKMFLDDEDFEKSISTLVQDVVTLMNITEDPVTAVS